MPILALVAAATAAVGVLFPLSSSLEPVTLEVLISTDSEWVSQSEFHSRREDPKMKDISAHVAYHAKGAAEPQAE